jgi:diguanylate cyclase (GGDEF)-like protein
LDFFGSIFDFGSKLWIDPHRTFVQRLRGQYLKLCGLTRHGGDEFTVILPDTDAAGAKNLAHRVASRLANDGGDPLVSFSYVVGAYPHDGNTLDQLLAVANSDLYQMKKSKP